MTIDLSFRVVNNGTGLDFFDFGFGHTLYVPSEIQRVPGIYIYALYQP